MKDIVLKDTIEVTGQYRGKSKFDFWHKMRVGDILTISMKLEQLGHYKATIFIKNETNGEKFSDFINSIQNYLYKIEYKTNQ